MVLERTQVIPRPRSEVFAFFENAKNLEVMTPPFLHFRLVTPEPIVMKKGTLIDYRLAMFGLPFRWRTEIAEYDRDVSFVDIQLRGPYRVWRHTHRFFDVPGGTRMDDHVEFEIPFGPLGTVARILVVERLLKRIFDYRAQAMATRFGTDGDADSASRR